MTVEIEDDSSIKRRLILRDSVAFFSLVSITVILFLITLFLFRSFTAHRADLAVRWSARGQAALSSGHPDQAIVALRTALSYAPGQRNYELLLAQALGDAGHTEESYNYFLGLWETQPGNGFINLSLARLAARKNDIQGAVNYYNAAVDGTWDGDAILRRRAVRLELAQYLMAHNNPAAARAQLLIASGNAPEDVSLTLIVARLLEQAGFTRDALTHYQKALILDPKNQTALLAAGRLAFSSGDFETANHLLNQADQDQADSNHALAPDIQAMLETSNRILSLVPSKKLQPHERVNRILIARALAKKRFDTCSAQISAASGLPAPLQTLGAQWQSKEFTISREDLQKSPEEQDATLKLIFDTELQTSQICGPPTGDDALLLKIANSPKVMEP
jgi:tetratricopeptide (TPR) repeat protein